MCNILNAETYVSQSHFLLLFLALKVKPEHTHFKRPPKGNQRLVVPTDGAFVIDFNLFQLDAVHRAQAAQGHNICLKTVCT